MKIANSAVAMAATTSFTQSAAKKSNLQYWVGDREPGAAGQMSSKDLVKADISALARKLSQQAEFAAPKQSAEGVSDDATDQSDGLTGKDKQMLQMLDEFLYRLTGKHFKFQIPDKDAVKKLRELRFKSPVQLNAPQAQPAPQKAGYGLIYDSYENYSEKASMSYSAAGQVKTQDGRTIDFNVALSMSREFQSSTEIHVRAGDARIDPLVINLSGGPQLSQRDFSFDIDNDGDSEQISKLLTGSGFLALDKNGDGQINNGGELFGPTMGNGFDELKTYDFDGNNWIDENDPVYDKLRIWMADEKGDMQLFALGQQGIGAIYLGNAASQFDIKDGQNDTLGTVQSTGVYLKENGGAGTIQHIDLTV
jgi:hypothetical protein